MEDQLVPRRVAFPAPPMHDIHSTSTSSTDNSSGATPRVLLATVGQAHVSCLTSDGRVWMLGMRGRGRAHDDSAARVNTAAAADATAPFAIKVDWAAEAAPPPPAADAAPDGRTDAAAFDDSVVPDAYLPELYMQTEPWEVRDDARVLTGRAVRALRSSAHHSYAVCDDGGVVRWGWAGVMMPVRMNTAVAAADATNVDDVVAATALAARVAGGGDGSTGAAVRAVDVACGHCHVIVLGEQRS